jgi:hypothetical protein
LLVVKVGTAREAAIDWVTRHASQQVWFRGAYFIGSTVALPEDSELATGSDIDVALVTSEAAPPPKPGKLLHKGALLEISLRPWPQLSSIDEVMHSYHLAAGLRVNTIIADPTGDLGILQQNVARHFTEEVWVRRRCKDARQSVENWLKRIDRSEPWHDQVTAWLFGTGVTTHVLLVAALRNPTIRLRYLAVRDVLEEYGRIALYPDLLQLLGCAELAADRVDHHLAALARTFDAAAAVAKSQFFFSSDITPAARSISIDGMRGLIRAGNHREAVFWIVATFARCHKILAADAPPSAQREFAPGFDDVLADLGIFSIDDLITRAESVMQFLPELSENAEGIIATNPGVTRKLPGSSWPALGPRCG